MKQQIFALALSLLCVSSYAQNLTISAKNCPTVAQLKAVNFLNPLGTTGFQNTHNYWTAVATTTIKTGEGTNALVWNYAIQNLPMGSNVCDKNSDQSCRAALIQANLVNENIASPVTKISTIAGQTVCRYGDLLAANLPVAYLDQ